MISTGSGPGDGFDVSAGRSGRIRGDFNLETEQNTGWLPGNHREVQIGFRAIFTRNRAERRARRRRPDRAKLTSGGESADRPASVSDALDGVVRSLQGGRQRGSVGAAAVGGVFGRWSEIVGDAMAAHVQPVKLDDRRLLVEVREPAWATQVKLLSEQLRRKISEVAGVDVESIDVRVAGSRR